MTVGKCSDFAHPSSFGFSGSAGKSAVRGHMRGGPVARTVKGDPAPSAGRAHASHASGKGGAHTFAKGGRVGAGAFGDNDPKHPKVRASAKAKPDAADRDDEEAEAHDKARGGAIRRASGGGVKREPRTEPSTEKNVAKLNKGGKTTKPLFGKKFGD